MLKRLAIVALMIFVLPVNGQQKAEHSESDKTDTKQKQCTPFPSPVTVNCGNSSLVQDPHSAKDADGPSNQPESYLRTLISANNLPNDFLALVGIIGIIVAVCTLIKLERQTKATEDAVEASLKQANHMIASERAWIMADVRFQPGTLNTAHTTHPLGEQTWANIELHLRNCGPTPAWVFQQWIRLELSPIVLMSDTPYQSPNLPHGPGIENADRTGRTSCGSYEILPLVREGEPHVWRTEIYDSGWATETNGLNIYIYGVVRYRDAFNSLRETYFGYTVRGGNLERIPSDAYNKHV